MTSESSRGGKYQLSFSGMLTYVTLWATVFAVVRVLAEHSSLGAEGSYPYSAAVVTDCVLPVAIGLVFVAIGVAIAYSFGMIKHVWGVAIWCFVLGCCSLPILWVLVVVLGRLGILDLD